MFVALPAHGRVMTCGSGPVYRSCELIRETLKRPSSFGSLVACGTSSSDRVRSELRSKRLRTGSWPLRTLGESTRAPRSSNATDFSSYVLRSLRRRAAHRLRILERGPLPPSQQGLPHAGKLGLLWPRSTVLPIRILQLCIATRSPSKVFMMLRARKIPLAAASVRSLIVESKGLFKRIRSQSV